MARKAKRQKIYEAVINDPASTPQEKMKAQIALDNYQKQRRNMRNHTKAKELLGLGAKDRVKSLFPEGSRPAGAYVCHDPDMRLVYAIEANETNPPTLPAVLPPLTAKELAEGKRLREDSDKKKAILAAQKLVS